MLLQTEPVAFPDRADPFGSLFARSRRQQKPRCGGRPTLNSGTCPAIFPAAC